MPKHALLLLLMIALSVGCAKKAPPTIPPVAPGPATLGWTKANVLLKPTNITAVRRTFWVCGAEETIASSSDGGASWQVRHSKPGGKTLLNISFIDETTGHAGGEGGLLLSTVDGGKTWGSHELGPATVQAFSFADADHGIAILSDRRGSMGMGMLDEVQGVPFLDSHVLLTHDGGQHWEEAVSLKNNEELRPYTEVLSVAALDPTHYLLGVRQPQAAVGYAVTLDAGTAWRLIHVDNVYATRVFVHDGEYWAFGIEYLNREKGGGYGAPVSIHSKDGEAWIHGARGPNEFPSCNAQGCYLWDGVVEDLYGARERFWLLPPDGTLTKTWAIAGDRGCTVARSLMCGPALATDQPPARP
jgi:photosystem II stability/assembly factor-like uncharacterized protein